MLNPGVVAAGLFGALLGPLLRGQIFRYAVPAGEARRRRCPHCGVDLARSTVAGRFGLLSPTGRCPGCPGRLGPATGVVEAVAGTVFAVLAWRVDGPLPLLAYAWIAVFGIVLGFVDVAVHRLPDRLTVRAGAGGVVLFGVAGVTAGQFARFGVALACGLAVVTAYVALVALGPGGLGTGDAKLGFAVGLATGWYGWAAAFHSTLAGLVLASGYAGALLLLRRINRRDHLPHGPAMLAGALAAVLATV